LWCLVLDVPSQIIALTRDIRSGKDIISAFPPTSDALPPPFRDSRSNLAFPAGRGRLKLDNFLGRPSREALLEDLELLLLALFLGRRPARKHKSAHGAALWIRLICARNARDGDDALGLEPVENSLADFDAKPAGDPLSDRYRLAARQARKRRQSRVGFGHDAVGVRELDERQHLQRVVRVVADLRRRTGERGELPGQSTMHRSCSKPSAPGSRPA
jgi:hypothetical protein